MLLKKTTKSFLKGLIILTLILILIYMIIGSNFLHIFTNNFMFDTREVKVYGKTYIEGKLDWSSIRQTSILLIYAVYIIVFIISEVFIMRKVLEVKNAVALEIHERIQMLKNNLVPENKLEYLGIDKEIKALIEERNELIKQNQDQVIQHNQSMAFLAHDLKTPLTSIFGYVSLLLDEPNISEENRKKYLKIIQEKSKELENLLNQFFDLAKFQLQISHLNLKKIDLLNLLIQMRETFYPKITQKNLKFEIDIEESIIFLVDQDLIARAFYNIIKNAIQYTKPGGKIRIYTISNSEYQSVIIENDVYGMTDEQASKLFQPFYRIDKSRNKSIEGSGLGLAISKEIMEKHKGRINSELTSSTLKIIMDFPLKMANN